MTIQVTVVLETCYDCMHRDHSGAFTPGGPKQTCDHPDACDERGSNWRNRVIREPRKIPQWCPIRHGSQY